MTASSVVTTLLWNALEASLLTVLLVGLLRARNFSAPIRHLLWLLVLAKLFMPPLALDCYGFSRACRAGWSWLNERPETTPARERPKSWNGTNRPPEALPSDDAPADGADDGPEDRSSLSLEPSARPLTKTREALPDARTYPTESGRATRSDSPAGSLDGSRYVRSRDPGFLSVQPGGGSTGDARLSDGMTKRPGLKEGRDASLREPRADTSFTRGARKQVLTDSDLPFDSATTARVLIILWGLGAVTMLLRQVLSIGAFRAGLRESQDASPEVRRQCATVAGRLGLRRVPAVRVLGISMSPLVWALGHPVLVLPRWTTRFSTATLRALLAHELAHIRRRDHWLCWLELAGACVYWWLPTFWCVQREMRRASDEAADAWAVWALRSRETYAEALFETVETLQVHVPRARVPLLGRGVGQKEFLTRRLTMIMREPIRLRLSWTARLGALVIAVLALPSSPSAATGTTGIETPQPAGPIGPAVHPKAASNRQPGPGSGQPGGIEPKAAPTPAPRDAPDAGGKGIGGVPARDLLQNLATGRSPLAPEQPLRARDTARSPSADVEDRLTRVEETLERVDARMKRLEKLLADAVLPSRRTTPFLESIQPVEPKDEPRLLPPEPKRAEPTSERPPVNEFRIYRLPDGRVAELAEFLGKLLNVEAVELGRDRLGLVAAREVHDVVERLSSLPWKTPSAAGEADAGGVITARVVDVDRARGLVVLSVGRDQGVETGSEFVVHRGRQRIADLEVIEVYPDLSGARVKALYHGQEIRQGDEAYSPLSSHPAAF